MDRELNAAMISAESMQIDTPEHHTTTSMEQRFRARQKCAQDSFSNMEPVLRSTYSLLEHGLRLRKSAHPDRYVRLTGGHLDATRTYANNAAQKYVLSFRDIVALLPYEEWIGIFEGIHTSHQKILDWKVDATYTAVAPVEKAHRHLNMAYQTLVDVVDQSPPTRNMTRT